MQTIGPPHDHDHAPNTSSQQPSAGPEKLPGIRHVIAVGSGKGGVGKSTVSVNLAFALQQLGGRIGLVDADVQGPSIPVMLGLSTGQPPALAADQKIIPADRHGLKAISMGMLTGDDNPAILRGPMVSKYLKMFIRLRAVGTAGLFDYRPPARDWRHATDVGPERSSVRRGHRDDAPGCEPQDRPPRAADVRDRACLHPRYHREYEHLHVPSLWTGHGRLPPRGGERISRQLGVSFLGTIPLDADIVTGGDEGRPIVVEKPTSLAAQTYLAIAMELAGRLQGLPQRC